MIVFVPLAIRLVRAAIWSSSEPSSAMFAIEIESRERSRSFGGSVFVYGWCAQAVVWKDRMRRSVPQRRSRAARPVYLRPLERTQKSSRMNGLGRMGDFEVVPLEPSGAVSPMRITSAPWPVASSARRPWYQRSRYMIGAVGIRLPPMRSYCGVSQPPWFGSL